MINRKLGENIEINHGGGGRRMDVLIRYLLDKININENEQVTRGSRHGDDGAVLHFKSAIDNLVISTDSHTVDPIFYRGGNIGDLSIVGTVNDVTVMGAQPLFITLGMIIEEGYSIAELGRIAESIGKRNSETGVEIIAGDTKVMPKGSLSNLVTNTTGIGVLRRPEPLTDSNAQIGDVVIVTGTIGDHGAALMSLREGIEFETDLQSDVAPFWPYFRDVITNPEVHCMKDLTRGGMASALNDIAKESDVLLELQENLVPIRDETQAICDMLGLEIMEISSEGKAVIVCTERVAAQILGELHKHDISKDARIIGTIQAKPKGRVHVISEIGGTRLLDKPYGEPIPRVC